MLEDFGKHDCGAEHLAAGRMGPMPAIMRPAESEKARKMCFRASAEPRRRASWSKTSVQRVEGAPEAAGMRLLGFRQGFEPVGDFVEALLAGGARHAGIHIGIF